MPLIESSLPGAPEAGSTGSQSLEFEITAGMDVLHPKVAKWTALIEVAVVSTIMQKRYTFAFCTILSNVLTINIYFHTLPL